MSHLPRYCFPPRFDSKVFGRGLSEILAPLKSIGVFAIDFTGAGNGNPWLFTWPLALPSSRDFYQIQSHAHTPPARLVPSSSSASISVLPTSYKRKRDTDKRRSPPPSPSFIITAGVEVRHPLHMPQWFHPISWSPSRPLISSVFIPQLFLNLCHFKSQSLAPKCISRSCPVSFSPYHLDVS